MRSFCLIGIESTVNNLTTYYKEKRICVLRFINYVGTNFLQKKDFKTVFVQIPMVADSHIPIRVRYIPIRVVLNLIKYSLQGTTQGRYLTGGVPPVRFSM